MTYVDWIVVASAGSYLFTQCFTLLFYKQIFRIVSYLYSFTYHVFNLTDFNLII